MLWQNWKSRWENAIATCTKLGGDAEDLIIANAASQLEVEEIEMQIEVKLPQSFRRVVTEYSSSVQMTWFLPDGFTLPKPLQGIFCGNCDWNLSLLPRLEGGRKEWVKTCFPNPDNHYDKVWHNKLAFQAVGNGDMLALDIAQQPSPVVYLSHDDGQGHGYILGKDFEDFIEKWSQLGCVGAEYWQMIPFILGPKTGLDPDCVNAHSWKKLFRFSNP